MEGSEPVDGSDGAIAALLADLPFGPFLDWVGATVNQFSAGCVLIRLPPVTGAAREIGEAPSAMIAPVGEAAAQLAALSLMPSDSRISTVEYKVSFIRQPKAGAFQINATVIRSGKSLSVVQVDIASSEAGGSLTPIGLMHVTLLREAR